MAISGKRYDFFKFLLFGPFRLKCEQGEFSIAFFVFCLYWHAETLPLLITSRISISLKFAIPLERFYLFQIFEKKIPYLIKCFIRLVKSRVRIFFFFPLKKMFKCFSTSRSISLLSKNIFKVFQNKNPRKITFKRNL